MSHANEQHSDFSSSGYLEANEDAEGNPLLHSLRDGPLEAPPQSEFATDYDLASGDHGVDRAWYLRIYPDVAAAGVDPVEHYVETGWREGRDPRPDFSTFGYLEANQQAEGNPLLHYLRHGGTKVPSSQSQFAADYDLASGDRGVDRAWYLQIYPDVAAAGVDPVEHYLREGWREGREPRADFSTSGYLEANRHVEGNPFLHYLRSTPEAHSAETEVTDWYLLWKQGVLYPKRGQEPHSSSAFGSRGVTKIVFTGHEATRTGAPLILLRLMEAMQARTGAELYLIIESGGPLLDDYRRIAHVLVNNNGMLYLPNGPKLARMLNSIAAPRPKLAICNSACSWRLTEALRGTRLSSVVSLIHERVGTHSADVWRSIHEASNCVIFPADTVKAATAAVLPIFNDASVVPQGLLKPEFGQGDRNAARLSVRNSLGLSPDASIILGCGTQDMRKGIDLFVQLASLVRARTKREIHFVWLGAKRELDFSRFIELDIGLLKLGSTVSLLDEVADPEPYFLAADAFALTSRDDPFPCVIHEAMACALPIVAFDGSGGAKEALSSDCGIVVPYLDLEAMARSLTSILEQPSKHARMGERAQSRVQSVYRFSDYAERIWKICQGQESNASSHGTNGFAPETGGVKREDRQVPLPKLKQRLHELLGKIARTIRAEQWWDYKLIPLYSVFYATAYVQHVSLALLWSTAVLLLLAIAPCAAYVSLINDLTDRADDRRAGKANRMEGRPVWQMAALVAAPLCVAAFFSILWRDDLRLVAVYLGAWAAFSLYSVPPFRLKKRGVFGVMADACGSHVFPTLTAVLLAQRATGQPAHPVWIVAAVAWALGCGLRGILWHQLHDVEADRKSGTQTFVVRHSRPSAMRLAFAGLLIECVGLGVLLWQIKSFWPVAFLLIYAAFAVLKSRLWDIAIVIAAPRGKYSILGQEYYILLFPLGVLLSSTLRYPADWAVLIAHMIVFAHPAVLFIGEVRALVQFSLRSARSSRGGTVRSDAPQPQAVCSNSNREDNRAMTPANASAATHDAAISKAAAFLRERLRSGSYGLASVGSDGTPRFPDDKGHLFVASFMAEAMTGLFDEIDRTIILTRILCEEQDGVWGYQSPGMLYTDETRPFLVDSDDTAFVIRTLHRLGVNREPRGLMRFYREPERLFVTWDTPGPTSLATESALQNNFRAHPEVNANIYHALRGTHFEKYVDYDMLLKAQDERGFWKSYFYPTPLYATLLVLDLTRGNPAFASAIERALLFIVGLQNADGSWGGSSDPYETALAVTTLAGHPAHAAATRRGVEYLLSTMAADGSWKSEACVWESHWNEHDIWRGYDTHRAYVTARCLTALRRAASQLAPP